MPQREKEISNESQPGDFGGLVFPVWDYLLERATFFKKMGGGHINSHQHSIRVSCYIALILK